MISLMTHLLAAVISNNINEQSRDPKTPAKFVHVRIFQMWPCIRARVFLAQVINNFLCHMFSKIEMYLFFKILPLNLGQMESFLSSLQN